MANTDIQDAIKKLDEFHQSSDRHSDWGNQHIRHLRGNIRSARLNAARLKGTHTKEEWISVLEEFNYRCVQCGCYPEGRPCKDHITPIYLGGSDALNNLQPLCRECNTAKGSDNFNWSEYRRLNGFADVLL